MDNSIRTVTQAQEAYELTLADWEAAVTRAKLAQERLDGQHLYERALGPADRHFFLQCLDDINLANACWTAHVRAREKYFRLLAEFGESEKPHMGRPYRSGFEDPMDPYRDTRRDDGSLRYAEKQEERDRGDRRDRRRDVARGYTLDEP